MSRDAIAEVLGRLDGCETSPLVADRLREVDGLLAAGVVVDIEDLLIDTDVPLWHELRKALRPMGWEHMVVWRDSEPDTVWVLPGTSHDQVRDATAPYVRVWHGICWWPALLTDTDKKAAGVDLFDDGPDAHDVDSADALLTWLSTP